MSKGVVVYHYVRPISSSRFPNINGIESRVFDEHIHHFEDTCSVLDIKALTLHNESSVIDLPNVISLTFDDGFLDHYKHVFPRLVKKHISGAFFPSIKPMVENIVLPVHKIHFVLNALASSLDIIINSIKEGIIDNHLLKDHITFSQYWNKFATKGRYDCKKVYFIKIMLQKLLPEALRNEIIDKLFFKFVTNNEREFSSELYMNPKQLIEMYQAGMYFGIHGYNHSHMDQLSPEEQEEDILKCINFYSQLGIPIKRWVMAYPYGVSNSSLVRIIKRKGCIFAFGIQSGYVSFEEKDQYHIARIDAKDIYKYY